MTASALAGPGCNTAAKPQAATALASRFALIFSSHLIVLGKRKYLLTPDAGSRISFLKEY
jgi:hypothetical protein